MNKTSFILIFFSKHILNFYTYKFQQFKYLIKRTTLFNSNKKNKKNKTQIQPIHQTHALITIYLHNNTLKRIRIIEYLLEPPNFPKKKKNPSSFPSFQASDPFHSSNMLLNSKYTSTHSTRS